MPYSADYEDTRKVVALLAACSSRSFVDGSSGRHPFAALRGDELARRARMKRIDYGVPISDEFRFATDCGNWKDPFDYMFNHDPDCANATTLTQSPMTARLTNGLPRPNAMSFFRDRARRLQSCRASDLFRRLVAGRFCLAREFRSGQPGQGLSRPIGRAARLCGANSRLRKRPIARIGLRGDTDCNDSPNRSRAQTRRAFSVRGAGMPNSCAARLRTVA